jgi:hypothetical protein
MTEPLAAARTLLAKAGIEVREPALEALEGGANNRVYRLRNGLDSYLLKHYWQQAGDRDRLGAEFEFARFARELEASPAGLARGEEMALYEFVEGRPAGPEDVTAENVGRAAEFAAGLVRLSRGGGEELQPAAEARFSVAGHLDLIEGRVQRLAGEADDEGCLELVRSRLVPAWESVRAMAEIAAGDLDSPLEHDERCVSPSDFGFHNALVEEGGGLRFIDFEYAGWDDPAKLVADFFCQPALPVPEEHLPEFAGSVLAELDDPVAAEARARVLLPCYRVKWVCIMLNEFLPAGARRRAFARGGDAAEQARELQLGRAAAALSRVEAATKPG